ncbi:MAG: COG1361 S-layer family protein [Haloferacaceae archaeon]
MHALTRLAIAAVVVFGALGGGVTAAAGQQTSGTVVGSPELELYSSTTEFEPGQRAELRLTVSNDGTLTRGGPAAYEDRVTTARGVVVDVQAGNTPIEVNSGPVAVGTVPTGTKPVPAVEITVPEDTPPGTYRVPVEMSYQYTSSVEYGPYEPEYNDFSREVTRHVTIRVRDRARFAVVGTTSAAQVGDTSTLRVTMENVGTATARDADVTLASPSDEITFGSGSAKSTGYVGAWAPGERRTINYTVALSDEAALRGYAFRATVGYEDTDGIARTSRRLQVGLRPAAEQSFALRDVNASLRVGQDGTFSGRVVNRGPGTARKPVVVFESNNRNVDVETAEFALPALDPGASAPFTFDVAVSDAATASSQQFSVTVRYRNQRGDRRTSDALEEQVRLRPERDRFVVEAVDPSVVAGGSTSLRLRVTNNGDDPLRNVEAKAFVQDPLSSDDDEGLIPRLAPGESQTVVVGLSVGGDALNKTYPVSLDFQYELPDGDTRVSRTYKVPVRVEQPEGGGLPFLPGAVAVLAVAVVGAVVWRRRGA